MQTPSKGLRVRRSRVFPALLVPLLVFGAAPAAAQTPRITQTIPASLTVQPAESSVIIEIEGENILDTDWVWTARNFRYFARRADDEGGWRRLYIGNGNGWVERREDLERLRRNGEVSGQLYPGTPFHLPAGLYADRPGVLELKVQRIEWDRVEVGEDDEAYEELVARVAAESAVHRVPIRAAPTEPPTVERVAPEHVAVENTRAGRNLRVWATNVTGPAEMTIGSYRCPVINLDPEAGWARCMIPPEILGRPGMYLVGLDTPNGGSRRLGRLWIDAPPADLALEPGSVQAGTADPAVTVRHSGGQLQKVELRAPGGAWQQARLADTRPDRATAVVPSALANRPAELDVRVTNAAGQAQARLLVCGGEGSPAGCPRTARVGAAPAGVARSAAPSAVAPRLRVAPGAVRLSPQPPPAGLRVVPIGLDQRIQLDDGRRLEARRVGGALRVHLVRADGQVLRVFPADAAVVRDANGNLSVRAEGGILPVGRIQSGR